MFGHKKGNNEQGLPGTAAAIDHAPFITRNYVVWFNGSTYASQDCNSNEIDSLQIFVFDTSANIKAV